VTSPGPGPCHPGDALGEWLADLARGLDRDELRWEDWARVQLFLAPTSADLTLSPAEQRLHDDLHHLERVVHRPRSYLRGEADVASADRAQRVARRAELHLSQHPENWARRTVRGVVPRRILAQFLEPDYDLYENRVAIDLLRILRATLPGRIAKLMEISEQFRSLYLYGTPDQKRRTATVWGASVDPGDRTRVIGALTTLRDVHRRVRAMRRTALASRWLRSAPKIRPPLRATNVLTHDADYRKVGMLWRTWAARQTAREDQAALAARRLKAARDYEQYCVAVTLRALAFLRFVPRDRGVSIASGSVLTMTGPGGEAALTREVDGSTVVSFGAAGSLRLVARYDHLTAGASSRDTDERIAAVGAGPRRIVLFPAEYRLRPAPDEDGPEPLPPALIERLSGIPTDRRDGPYLVQATPDDLLTVERLGRLLRREAWGPTLLAGFATIDAPRVLAKQDRLPRWVSRDGGGLRVARCATDSERQELRGDYDRARRTLQAQGRRAATELAWLERERQGVEAALDDTQRAARCPVCRSAKTKPSLIDDGGYAVRCDDCGAGWGISACPTCRRLAPSLLPARHPQRPGEPGAIDRHVGLDAIVSHCCDRTLWGREWVADES